MGPGYAELAFEERPSEPVIGFLADKTEPGAWNLPLYKIFADPFNTAGLVIDAKMLAGFVFEVYDLFEDQRVEFDCPAELHDLQMFIGAPARYVVHAVRSKTLPETAAATSTQRLSLIAGRYVGKDDPVMIVRCQSGLPAVGEVLEPFATPWTVAGCMRGSHHAPLIPVGQADAHPSRFAVPPRVVAPGFQVTAGRLIGPRDLFADVAFDRARAQANEVMDYLRRRRDHPRRSSRSRDVMRAGLHRDVCLGTFGPASARGRAQTMTRTDAEPGGRVSGVPSSTGSSPAQRRKIAQAALDAPGGRSEERVLCSVRCTRSHHVATVFATPAGPVYQALTGPHAHGRRDFVDTGHHGARHGTAVVDLLDAGGNLMVDDLLPAWCECGPRMLSRAVLQNALNAHQRQLLVT